MQNPFFISHATAIVISCTDPRSVWWICYHSIRTCCYPRWLFWNSPERVYLPLGPELMIAPKVWGSQEGLRFCCRPAPIQRFKWATLWSVYHFSSIKFHPHIHPGFSQIGGKVPKKLARFSYQPTNSNLYVCHHFWIYGHRGRDSTPLCIYHWDGDSSVFPTLIAEVPGWGRTIQKVECANHACKWYRASLEKPVQQNPTCIQRQR